MKIPEIIFSKCLRVGVDVYVAIELLKTVLCRLGSVYSDVIRMQVELHTTSHTNECKTKIYTAHLVTN